MEKLDRQLQKRLEEEEQKIKLKAIREKHYNKYGNAAIMFIGTLIPLYILFFIASYIFNFFFGSAIYLLGANIGWLSPLMHAVIWLAAVISVYREKSVLDDILTRF
jgi:hypothetical protein